MKNFTKNIWLIPALAFGLLLTMPSCKDECKDVTCLNNGTCNEDNGECDCLTGFSGTQCEIEDKCVTGNVQCVNGDCDPDTGTCNCEDGWVGDNCEIEERADWIGIFKMAEDCDIFQDGTYDIDISRPTNGNSDAEITINNLNDRGFGVTGVVSGLNVTIATQTIGTATVEGTGVLITTTDPQTIEFELRIVDDANGPDDCTSSGVQLN